MKLIPLFEMAVKRDEKKERYEIGDSFLIDGDDEGGGVKVKVVGKEGRYLICKTGEGYLLKSGLSGSGWTNWLRAEDKENKKYEKFGELVPELEIGDVVDGSNSGYSSVKIKGVKIVAIPDVYCAGVGKTKNGEFLKVYTSDHVQRHMYLFGPSGDVADIYQRGDDRTKRDMEAAGYKLPVKKPVINKSKIDMGKVWVVQVRSEESNETYIVAADDAKSAKELAEKACESDGRTDPQARSAKKLKSYFDSDEEIQKDVIEKGLYPTKMGQVNNADW